MFHDVLFVAGNAGKVPLSGDITMSNVASLGDVTLPGGRGYPPPGVTSDGYYHLSAWHTLRTQGKRGILSYAVLGSLRS